MLDFVGPPGYAVKLAELCKEVQVLDHHKTAMADLGEVRPSNMKVVFDMERSGASISRDFFQPKVRWAMQLRGRASRSNCAL